MSAFGGHSMNALWMCMCWHCSFCHHGVQAVGVGDLAASKRDAVVGGPWFFIAFCIKRVE